ncbi:MAG TPA: hypothetical protein VGE47_01920 [Burkholderiaceae bacterium]
MLNNDPSVDTDEGFMPSLMAAAELQDHLMTVSNDLERLQRLLDDAGASLSEHFFAASAHLEKLAREAAEAGRDGSVVQKLQGHIAAAITALQFQDMSTQLIAHTSQRLRNCSDQLARDTFGDDEDGMAVVEIAPLRPNPVTQDEMDAGSIELF